MIYPFRTEYAIIEGNIDEIFEEVNRRIKDGWTPLGGVTVVRPPISADDVARVAQAMTREVLK